MTNIYFKTAAITLAIVAAAATATAQTISANGSTTITAQNDGNLGILYPLLDGRASTIAERERFVYEIRVNAQYVNLTDAAASTFYLAQNGYDDASANNQYGFGWADGIWFKPVTRDYQFRIGYPTNGQAGGSIGNNWVEYNLAGNPNAYRPNPGGSGNTITLATPDNPNIPGWELVWSDEFNGNSLDNTKWNIDIGVGQNGWGNEERQYYTNDPANLFVSNGKLNFKSSKQVRNNNGYESRYNSGKVTSSQKFSWKYGRIDFLVKLPLGEGYWPACWMMPQGSVYGGWAASGEIDVMEAKGRFPSGSSGAIHFGGAWPNNTYIHGDYSFPSGRTINDFNVYSLVWEQAQMKWYVNGNLFRTINNTQWRSDGAPNNQYAPFDQNFFIIMNLAIGGHFDGYREPGDAELGRTMEIDYVRVYKPGSSNSAITVTHNGKGTVKAGNTTINSGSYAEVQNGGSVILTFTPNAQYQVSDVKINGTRNSQAITNASYTFANVTGSQAIEVTFAKRISIPATFNATEYSQKSNEIVPTVDGNGTYVGYLENGSTLEYLISAAQAGTYKVSAKTATQGANRSISIYNGNQTTALATLNAAATATWYAWTETSADITLPAGNTTLRLVASGAVNIENIEISLGGGASTAKKNREKAAFAFAGISASQINVSLKQGNYTVELCDLKGRLIDKVDVGAVNGVNATGLKVDKLSKGVYFLNVKTYSGESVYKNKIQVK